jgi:hypothetical protein
MVLKDKAAEERAGYSYLAAHHSSIRSSAPNEGRCLLTIYLEGIRQS